MLSKKAADINFILVTNSNLCFCYITIKIYELYELRSWKILIFLKNSSCFLIPVYIKEPVYKILVCALKK